MQQFPPPGSIGFTRAGGVHGLAADLVQVVTGAGGVRGTHNQQRRYNQAVIVMDQNYVMMPGPGGPQMRRRRGLRDMMFVWPTRLTPAQRSALTAVAWSLADQRRGCRLRDLAYAGLLRCGLRWGWLTRRAGDVRRVTPAQFISAVYRDAGVPLPLNEMAFKPGSIPAGDAATVADLVSLMRIAVGWDQRRPLTAARDGRPA